MPLTYAKRATLCITHETLYCWPKPQAHLMNGTQTALFGQNNISLICNPIYIYILRLNYCFWLGFWLNTGIKNFIDISTTKANLEILISKKTGSTYNNVYIYTGCPRKNASIALFTLHTQKLSDLGIFFN